MGELADAATELIRAVLRALERPRARRRRARGSPPSAGRCAAPRRSTARRPRASPRGGGRRPPGAGTPRRRAAPRRAAPARGGRRPRGCARAAPAAPPGSSASCSSAGRAAIASDSRTVRSCACGSGSVIARAPGRTARRPRAARSRRGGRRPGETPQRRSRSSASTGVGPAVAAEQAADRLEVEALGLHRADQLQPLEVLGAVVAGARRPAPAAPISPRAWWLRTLRTVMPAARASSPIVSRTSAPAAHAPSVSVPLRWGLPLLASRTSKPPPSRTPNATCAGRNSGSLKRTSTVNASGQRRLELGQAARLDPHPVRDRARHAEQLRAPAVQVDRVAVARDRAVAAADVAGHAPVRPRRPAGRLALALGPEPAGAARRACAGRRCASATRAPVAHGRLGVHRELRPAVVRLEVLRVHPQRERLVRRDRPSWSISLRCARARARERERALGHDPHRQRERDDVRVGRRQRGPRARSRRPRGRRPRCPRSRRDVVGPRAPVPGSSGAADAGHACAAAASRPPGVERGQARREELAAVMPRSGSGRRPARRCR